MKKLYVLCFLINLTFSGEKLDSKYIFVKFNKNKVNLIVNEIASNNKITKVIVKHSSLNNYLANQIESSIKNNIVKPRNIIVTDKVLEDKFFKSKVVVLTFETV